MPDSFVGFSVLDPFQNFSLRQYATVVWCTLADSCFLKVAWKISQAMTSTEAMTNQWGEAYPQDKRKRSKSTHQKTREKGISLSVSRVRPMLVATTLAEAQ